MSSDPQEHKTSLQPHLRRLPTPLGVGTPGLGSPTVELSVVPSTNPAQIVLESNAVETSNRPLQAAAERTAAQRRELIQRDML